MLEINQIHHGDCLDLMQAIPDGSIDMILADLPYGVTDCSWDIVIPLERLWGEYKRVIKKDGAVVLFGSQPFTTILIMSNLDWFRYDLIWQKDQPTGGLNANRMPLRNHEEVLVFYQNLPTYNPQKFNFQNARLKLGEGNSISLNNKDPNRDIYGHTWCDSRYEWVETGKRYPLSVMHCSSKQRSVDNVHITRKTHPTQKPVALFAYLIRTYTNPGELVLDNVAGSGTTAIAAIETGRDWLCIEKDKRFFQLAGERIKEKQRQPALPGLRG